MTIKENESVFWKSSRSPPHSSGEEWGRAVPQRQKEAGRNSWNLEEPESHVPVLTEVCSIPALLTVCFHMWAHRLSFFPKQIQLYWEPKYQQRYHMSQSISRNGSPKKEGRRGTASHTVPGLLCTRILFKIPRPWPWPPWKTNSPSLSAPQMPPWGPSLPVGPVYVSLSLRCLIPILEWGLLLLPAVLH